MAKFAPLMPMSASMYFCRKTRRAIIVSSSGSFVGTSAHFALEQLADLAARQVHRTEKRNDTALRGEAARCIRRDRFDDLVTFRLQRVVEVNLLAVIAFDLTMQRAFFSRQSFTM